jgi:hypothetical protein
MKYSDIDWKILRGAIATLVISISISGTLIYLSMYFQDRMYREFTRNELRFQSISKRYLAVDEEEKLIKKYYPRFVELYKKGVIGKEQRLNWIEVLRTAGMQIQVPTLTYQIESQDTYKPGYSVTLGKFRLYSSKMTLNMRLLHEGDLFNILNELNKKANGIYSLNSCRLSKNSKIVESADAPNINAECDLQWFTIKLANGKDINV